MITTIRRTALLLCIFTSISSAANFKLDFAQSELAATMHASPSHDFTSTAQSFECDIQLDPKTLTLIDSHCAFRFQDLDSEKSSRDTKMCKWMDINRHPMAEFQLTRIETDEATGKSVAWGNFTMHAETHEISIPYTIKREGDIIIIEGESEIDHRQWGLDQVRLLFFSVDPILKPHFRLVGTLQYDR